MSTSQNGYAANDRSRVESRRIPGTTRDVTLRKGSPGWLLLDMAAWFDKNIESVDGGTYDDWGYAERSIRGSSTTLSNHASGTALDLNATRHPLGTLTFSAKEKRKIRRRLKKYDGCIRWGGDYNGRKDEMHFEIVASPARCKAVRIMLQRKDSPVAKKKRQPKRRPKNIGAALADARAARKKVIRAHKYAKKHNQPGKARKTRAAYHGLRDAIKSLLRINKRR